MRCPSSRAIPTRVGFLSLGSMSMTLEMWIGPSFSITPPTVSARWAFGTCVGRWWRLMMFRPSTKTRDFLGSTRRTLPVLPRSLPEMTMTSSSRRILRAILEHLRGEADDLHEVALAQLAGHRPEDARPARVVLRVDDHRGVLVEGDVRPVVAAEGLLRAHDDRRDDLALLDRALGVGGLHRRSDDVADECVAAARAALDADAEDLAGARVVGDLEARLVLDHLACSRTSTSRQSFVRLSGRDSTMRTRSPSLASLVASWACSVDDERTIFS